MVSKNLAVSHSPAISCAGLVELCVGEVARGPPETTSIGCIRTSGSLTTIIAAGTPIGQVCLAEIAIALLIHTYN